MNDRELLELAAKAAGITGFSGEDHQGAYFCTPANHDIPRSEPTIYRWLADDGDALRLAVRLGISLYLNNELVYAEPPLGDPHGENRGLDDLAATRRAITRAAAELGRAL